MQNFGKGKLNNAQYLTRWRIHDKKSGVCGSLNFFCICLRRQDEYMFQGRRIDGDAPLSNQTMEIRRRKREICNRIHNSTWLIETIAILSGGIFQLLALRVDPYIVSSVEDILSLLIYRLLVPFTSLFSENRIKGDCIGTGLGFCHKNCIEVQTFNPSNSIWESLSNKRVN